MLRNLLSATAAAALIAGAGLGVSAPALGYQSADEAPVGELDDRATPTAARLDLRLDPREDRFSGVAEIDLTLNRATDLIWIHGRGLTVSRVELRTADGESIAATYEEVLPSGVAAVRLERAHEGDGTLAFDYDASFDTTLAGLYVTADADERYLASQMQDSDYRRMAPGFDQPRFKIPYDFTITARSGDVVIVNTPEESATDLGDGWTRHEFKNSRPLPSEVLAVAVGPYDVVAWDDMSPNEVRDHAVPLRGVAAKGKGEQIGYALENTAGLLTALEDYFGIAYPYEKLDLIAPTEFAAGAMENPGAIMYRETLLLIDDNASYNAKRQYALVHAHEMAHMWFGNLVTPTWWTDIWLNEAFASWMGDKATDAWDPDGGYDRETLKNALGVMGADSLATARSIRTPIERTEDIGNAFDGITYNKGAGVLAMFESYLGEEDFRRGVQLHMERFADGVADFNDFAESLAEGSGKPEVVSSFTSFVTQPGIPLVTATLDCTGDAPIARVSQTSYRPLGSAIPADRRWEVPVCVSYGADGDRAKSCGLLADDEGVLELETDACPVSIFPNAEGAGYYRFSTDQEGWASLRADLADLPVSEQLVFEDSLSAAFNAGEVSATDFLQGIRLVMASNESDVASAARGSLNSQGGILEGDAKDDLRAFAAKLIKPKWSGDVEGGEAELFAQQISAALVFDLRDQTRMQELTTRINATLDNGGDAAAAGLPGYAINEAVTAAIAIEGEAFYDKAIAVFAASKSPQLKAAILSGLANSWDPELAARMRDEALNGDVFTGREMASLVFGLVGQDETKDATFNWLEANFDAFVAKMPAGWRAGAGGLVSVYCDMDKANEIKAFVESKADLIPGYELAMAQNMESVALCAAKKEAKADELAAALAALTD